MSGTFLLTFTQPFTYLISLCCESFRWRWYLFAFSPENISTTDGQPFWPILFSVPLQGKHPFLHLDHLGGHLPFSGNRLSLLPCDSTARSYCCCQSANINFISWSEPSPQTPAATGRKTHCVLDKKAHAVGENQQNVCVLWLFLVLRGLIHNVNFMTCSVKSLWGNASIYLSDTDFRFE